MGASQVRGAAVDRRRPVLIDRPPSDVPFSYPHRLGLTNGHLRRGGLFGERPL